MTEEDNYTKYRGKCKEMSEALVAADPTLRLVRGHYWDAFWGDQPHWWCEKPDGTVVDPTKDQFPTKGKGDYHEFSGIIPCSQCGKEMTEDEADIDGRYAFCSGECHCRFVGVM
jgi:hypothetical protein